MEQEEMEKRRDLMFYRIETAKIDLKSAKLLFCAGEYRGANNRAYHAIYRLITALQAVDEKPNRRHKDLLSGFNRDYLRPGTFPHSLGRRIAKAQENMRASDYDDFYIATQEEASTQIKTAEDTLHMIETYCQRRTAEN